MGRKGIEVTRYDRQRKHKRFKLSNQTTIQFKTKRMTSYKCGIISNISKSGVGFSVNDDIALTEILYPNDKIVDLFANLPDFDRKMTEYQVEFAKKKGYVPHSCATLKSFNLCKAKKYDDELCMGGFFSRKLEETKKIAHPLFYVQFKQFTRSKSQNQNEPKTEKTDS